MVSLLLSFSIYPPPLFSPHFLSLSLPVDLSKCCPIPLTFALLYAVCLNSNLGEHRLRIPRVQISRKECCVLMSTRCVTSTAGSPIWGLTFCLCHVSNSVRLWYDSHTVYSTVSKALKKTQKQVYWHFVYDAAQTIFAHRKINGARVIKSTVCWMGSQGDREQQENRFWDIALFNRFHK